ncbi:hypothetical protein DF018_33610 [Burkholderia cenocepacia]|nr:hypothetical protein AS149_32510 [Burkholderia cenocepacia]RQU84927.1 hypothetical protein DF133_26830 [Burkholderia cenocepacia]RQV57137.1 hypothetical protein DF018_33610 [Burkholderia cenocepacia]RQV85118.1 hypothetical protein DF019_28355 [Burkholderia cenocepacia]
MCRRALTVDDFAETRTALQPIRHELVRQIRVNLHVTLSLRFLESIDRRASCGGSIRPRRMRMNLARIAVALSRAVVGPPPLTAQAFEARV